MGKLAKQKMGKILARLFQANPENREQKSSASSSEPEKPSARDDPNFNIFRGSLCEMGFEFDKVERALFESECKGVQEAIDYMFSNPNKDMSDYDEPKKKDEFEIEIDEFEKDGDCKIFRSQDSYQQLVACYSGLFNNKEYSDVIFMAGKKADEVYAHRCILASRSPYFKNYFDTKVKDKNPKNRTFSVEEIKLPKINVSAVKSVVEYIYTGSLKIEPGQAENVIAAAQEFELVEHLFKSFSGLDFDVETVCFIIEAVGGDSKETQNLFSRATAFIEKYTQKVFKTDTFLELSPKIFQQLLVSHKLSIDEIEVYDHCKNWAKFQVLNDRNMLDKIDTKTEIQSSNILNDLVSEDDELFRKHFMEMAYHIRYPQMTPVEVRDVLEKEKLVPKHLIMEAFRSFVIDNDKKKMPKRYLGDDHLAALWENRYSPRIGSRLDFTWSSKHKSAKISLTNNYLNATNRNTNSAQTVLGNKAITKGKHYWEVRINYSKNRASDIMIGVTDESTVSLTNYCSHNSRGYAYYARNGNKYFNSGSVAYGQPFNMHDKVGVLLNMQKGELSFVMNGVSQGVAYTGLSGSYRPAVSLPNKDDSVTLFATPQMPKSLL